MNRIDTPHVLDEWGLMVDNNISVDPRYNLRVRLINQLDAEIDDELDWDLSRELKHE